MSLISSSSAFPPALRITFRRLILRPPIPVRKMRRRNVILNAGGKADDDDMNKTPFRLPNSLWTNQSDLKKRRSKRGVRHLPVVRDDGGNTTGHGPGRWVRKRVQRRRERERDDE